MSKAYSSNLTQAQLELLESLIPPAKSGGRPQTVDRWAVINAIFYVLTQNFTWRNLPGDLQPWQTVHHYFRLWRKDSTWLAIHDNVNYPAQSPWANRIASGTNNTAKNPTTGPPQRG